MNSLIQSKVSGVVGTSTREIILHNLHKNAQRMVLSPIDCNVMSVAVTIAKSLAHALELRNRAHMSPEPRLVASESVPPPLKHVPSAGPHQPVRLQPMLVSPRFGAMYLFCSRSKVDKTSQQSNAARSTPQESLRNSSCTFLVQDRAVVRPPRWCSPRPTAGGLVKAMLRGT